MAVTAEAAESGLVQTLVRTFQRQSGVTMNVRIVAEPEAHRLAAQRVVQVVLTTEPGATGKYLDVARLADVFASRDFVIAGPGRDPAHLRKPLDPADALRRIAKRNAHFCSAADVPQIRRYEAQLWAAAALDPRSLRHYEECHGDALAALQEADRKRAYTLTDVETDAAAKKSLDIKIFSGPSSLLHADDSVILVEHTPRIRRDRDAEWFVQWLMSYQGRDVIQNFQLHEAQGR